MQAIGSKETNARREFVLRELNGLWARFDGLLIASRFLENGKPAKRPGLLMLPVVLPYSLPFTLLVCLVVSECLGAQIYV